MMTPEQAFVDTLEKWQEIAAGKRSDDYKPHLKICGFCLFDIAMDLDVCGGCMGLRHFGVQDCFEDIPELVAVNEVETHGPDYCDATAKVVALLEEHKDGLIAAGHAILREIEDA